MDAYDIKRIGLCAERLPLLDSYAELGFPPLGNLLIVASHADPRRHETVMSRVTDRTAQRIVLQIGESSLQRRAELSGRELGEKELRDRIHFFWKDAKHAETTFSEQLAEIFSSVLPKAWRRRASEEISALRASKLDQLDRLLEMYKQRLERQQELEKLYDGYLKDEPARQHKLKQRIEEIVHLIETLSKASADEFRGRYERIVDEDSLERRVRGRFSEKGDAKKHALAYVFEVLNEDLRSVLEPKTKRVSDAAEMFVKEYGNQQTLKGASVEIGITADDMGAFLIGAVSTGSLGGLASLGLAYGGTWLAAHTTGVLVSIGLGVAKVGALVATGLGAALSILTGPVGLGLLAGAALWAIFSDSWQRKMAKEIRRTIQKEEILEKMLKVNKQHWSETKAAFLAGVEEMERRRQKGMKELKYQIDRPEEGERQMREFIDQIEAAQGFFLRLELSPSVQVPSI
jgi:hypothetical protein